MKTKLWASIQKTLQVLATKIFKAKLTQLAHDVVTKLGFGCILVALSQRCVSDVVTRNKKCLNMFFRKNNQKQNWLVYT